MLYGFTQLVLPQPIPGIGLCGWTPTNNAVTSVQRRVLSDCMTRHRHYLPLCPTSTIRPPWVNRIPQAPIIDDDESCRTSHKTSVSPILYYSKTPTRLMVGPTQTDGLLYTLRRSRHNKGSQLLKLEIYHAAHPRRFNYFKRIIRNASRITTHQPNAQK